jgi:uncharacterized protein YciI
MRSTLFVVAWYLLLGFDSAGFWETFDQVAEDELDEAHQLYMDGVADRLFARGPMLTATHDGHEGSVHILKANSHDAAQRFALNEPYYAAGLYRTLEVFRFDPWLRESMWERVGDPGAGCSWLVLLRCSGSAARSVPLGFFEVADLILCAGWMFDGVTGLLVGAAFLVDAKSDVVRTLVNTLAEQFGLDNFEPTVIPWRRGGRDSI